MSIATITTPTPLVADTMRTIGQALIDLADKMDAPSITPPTSISTTTTIPVTDEPTKAQKREARRKVVENTCRRQYEVLKTLTDNGGSMPQVDFIKVASDLGYSKGYAQYYADRVKSDSLCTLHEGVVTITEKGKNRLAWDKNFLGL